MNSVAYDVADMLAAESLSLVEGTNMFINHAPDGQGVQDNIISIFDTPGGPPQLTFTDDEDYYYDSFNIRVRNRSQATAYTLAANIMTALHGRAQETWNGTLYSLIRCVNTPALLSWDNNNRCLWTINFECQRR